MKKKFLAGILAAIQLAILSPKAYADDTVTVKEYRYYYFLCEGCGDHNPFSSACGCGSRKNSWNEKWFSIPYSESGWEEVSYTDRKYQTFSLGDGQHWYFSSGNLYDTEPGSIDSDGRDVIIRLREVPGDKTEQSTDKLSEEDIGGKYWCYGFGATVGTNLPCRFDADGTAVDVNGEEYRWEVKDGRLLFGGDWFVPKGNGFESEQMHYSGAGGFNNYMYYSLYPSDREAFESRYVGDAHKVEKNSWKERPRSESWLDMPERKVVKSKYGKCIYLLNAPSPKCEPYDTVNEAEEVIVFARQGNYSYVQTEDGRLGWCKTALLADKAGWLNCEKSRIVYAKLLNWDGDEAKLQLLDYDGRDENSCNYVFHPGNTTLILDLHDSKVLLENAWGDAAAKNYDSINEALAAKTEDNGPSVGDLLCGFINLRIEMVNDEAKSLEILYAA